MKRNATLFSVVFTVFCSAILLAQSPAPAKDPRTGTWKLNLAKSKYAEGTTAPKMQVRTYTARPDGFSVSVVATVDAQGNAAFTHTTLKLDGKAYPTYNQTTLADFSATGAKPGTLTYKLLDPNTVEQTSKDNAGKVTGTTTYGISKDGKTLTITAKDTAGKVTTVTVWDK